MRLRSTAQDGATCSFSEAILSSLSPAAGLWVPEQMAALPEELLAKMPELPFAEAAAVIGQALIGDEIEQNELLEICQQAFDFPLPLVPVGPYFVLELFHGPTLAFKDFGARFLARLLERKRAASDPTLTILVATSGDTGSAVAHAFSGLEGLRVVVLFPQGQVSEAQRRLFTTLGGNVHSVAVGGTFDDCQRLAKWALGSSELRDRCPLASSNSINIGRLLPQIFYYFGARSALVRQGRDPRLVFSTPSGNFGNLTAGLYAQRLGLGAAGFLAATNINDVVPAYLDSGRFEPRPSSSTLSNAMDVGNPSNFLRILDLYERDHGRVVQEIRGARITDDETLETMRRVYEKEGYWLDPHTAVGYRALEAVAVTGIVLATAHPAKFPDTVFEATGQRIETPPALERIEHLDESITPMAAKESALGDFLCALP